MEKKFKNAFQQADNNEKRQMINNFFDNPQNLTSENIEIIIKYFNDCLNGYKTERKNIIDRISGGNQYNSINDFRNNQDGIKNIQNKHAEFINKCIKQKPQLVSDIVVTLYNNSLETQSLIKMDNKLTTGGLETIYPVSKEQLKKYESLAQHRNLEKGIENVI